MDLVCIGSRDSLYSDPQPPASIRYQWKIPQHDVYQELTPRQELMIEAFTDPPQEASEQSGTSRPVGHSFSLSSSQGQPAESPSWHQLCSPLHSEHLISTSSEHGVLGLGVPGGGTGNPGGGIGKGMIGGYLLFFKSE